MVAEEEQKNSECMADWMLLLEDAQEGTARQLNIVMILLW